jgi:hypothetical protein
LFYKKQADAEAFKDTLLAEIMSGKGSEKISSNKLSGKSSTKANLSKSDESE